MTNITFYGSLPYKILENSGVASMTPWVKILYLILMTVLYVYFQKHDKAELGIRTPGLASFPEVGLQKLRTIKITLVAFIVVIPSQFSQSRLDLLVEQIMGQQF